MEDIKKGFNSYYELKNNWSQDIKDIWYEINMQEEFLIK